MKLAVREPIVRILWGEKELPLIASVLLKLWYWVLVAAALSSAVMLVAANLGTS